MSTISGLSLSTKVIGPRLGQNKREVGLRLKGILANFIILTFSSIEFFQTIFHLCTVTVLLLQFFPHLDYISTVAVSYCKHCFHTSMCMHSKC